MLCPNVLLVLAERLATSRSRGRRFSSSNAISFFSRSPRNFSGDFREWVSTGFINIIINIRSGRKLRAFTGGLEDFLLPGAVAAAGGRGGFAWPVFKWAGGGEDKYFAKIGKNAVFVYEAPEVALLDKKSLRLVGCTDFACSLLRRARSLLHRWRHMNDGRLSRLKRFCVSSATGSFPRFVFVSHPSVWQTRTSSFLNLGTRF